MHKNRKQHACVRLFTNVYMIDIYYTLKSELSMSVTIFTKYIREENICRCITPQTD